MTVSERRLQIGTPAVRAPAWRRLADYAILTKPGITLMVMLSTLTGFVTASAGPVRGELLLWTVLGTGLVSAGAATMNMLWERREDGLMRRTRGRPLPAGRLSSAEAFVVGLLCGTVGIAILTCAVSPVASVLSGLSFLLYVFAYTPLKKVSRVSVAVGAVCGAIPPLVGSAAAGHPFTLPAGILFAALFLWQYPHVAAIHFLQQEEFKKAGFVRLAEGGTPSSWLLVYTIAPAVGLALCGIVPLAYQAGGILLAAAAIALAAYLLRQGLRFAREPDLGSARQLFFATLAFLPGFLAMMMADHVARFLF